MVLYSGKVMTENFTLENTDVKIEDKVITKISDNLSDDEKIYDKM